jgi:hypothetical protein
MKIVERERERNTFKSKSRMNSFSPSDPKNKIIIIIIIIINNNNNKTTLLEERNQMQ